MKLYVIIASTSQSCKRNLEATTYGHTNYNAIFFSISCAYTFRNDLHRQKIEELYACPMISSPVSEEDSLNSHTQNN